MEVIVNKQVEIDAMENRAVQSELDCNPQRDLCMDTYN